MNQTQWMLILTTDHCVCLCFSWNSSQRLMTNNLQEHVQPHYNTVCYAVDFKYYAPEYACSSNYDQKISNIMYTSLALMQCSLQFVLLTCKDVRLCLTFSCHNCSVSYAICYFNTYCDGPNIIFIGCYYRCCSVSTDYR